MCGIIYPRIACRPCNAETPNGKAGKWCKPQTDEPCEELGEDFKCTKCDPTNPRVGGRNLYCKPGTATVCARSAGNADQSIWDVVDALVVLSDPLSLAWNIAMDENPEPFSVFLDQMRQRYLTKSGVDFETIWGGKLQNITSYGMRSACAR